VLAIPSNAASAHDVHVLDSFRLCVCVFKVENGLTQNQLQESMLNKLSSVAVTPFKFK